MKKILAISVMLFISLLHGQLTNNLLLEYKFNGNADDSSGNNYHATVHGATLAPDRNGNPNSAYYFDGVNDYIEWPNLAALKPQLPVSFSFWVRYDSSDWQDQTVFSTSEQDDHAAGIWFNSTAAQSKFAVNYGDGSFGYTSETRRTFVADTVIDTENWYHLVVVVKGPNDMHIYVNCDEFQGNYSGSGGPIQYSAFPGVLGKHDRTVGGPPDFFKGYIDDFMYWNREVQPEEVFGLCQTLPPPVLTINHGCESNDYLLTVVSNQPVPVGTTFAWTGPGNFSASGNPVIITDLSSGTYVVTATFPGNVVVTQSVVIADTMCPAPEFTVSHGCIDDVYMLTATPNQPVPSQTILTWSGPEGFSASGASAVITGLPAGTYTFTALFPNSLSVTQSVEVLNPVCSEPGFTISQGCIGDDYFLTAIPNQPLISETDFAWSGPGNFSAVGNPVVITGLPSGTYWLVATLPDDIISESVTVGSTLCRIQKGVSPESSSNNTFDLSGFDVDWVKIFNRYGMKVYEKGGYVNDWRGQDDQGHELPDGTYYYQIQLESGQIMTGWVYLLRRS